MHKPNDGYVCVCVTVRVAVYLLRRTPKKGSLLTAMKGNTNTYIYTTIFYGDCWQQLTVLHHQRRMLEDSVYTQTLVYTTNVTVYIDDI